MHGLPMAGMNKRNLTFTGASIGDVLEVEPLPDGITCKRFFRVKVRFPVYSPLKTGFLLPRHHLSDALIQFRYEKLSDCCYHFGCLGHTLQVCSNVLGSSVHSSFGTWLRAYSWNSSAMAFSSVEHQHHSGFRAVHRGRLQADQIQVLPESSVTQHRNLSIASANRRVLGFPMPSDKDDRPNHSLLSP